jgi:integrase
MKNGIEKRGNSWSYIIRIPDSNTGKTKPKWVGGFRTEVEAKLARDKARGKLASGTYVKPTKINVEQYLNEWIEIHSHSLKKSTAQSYRGHIKRNLVPYLGKIALSDLRASHIQRLYADLLSKGNEMGNPLSSRSVEFAGSVLSKALKHAVEIDELIAMNPATRVSKPRGKGRKNEPFSIVEATSFLEAVASQRLFPFFRLAFYSGARKGEMLALRWNDLDTAKKTLLISKNRLRIIGGDIEQDSTKGGDGRRIVTLDEGTVEILRQLRKSQMEDRLLAGNLWIELGYIFTDELGKPLAYDLPSRTFQRVSKRLNLPTQRFHDCRHFHATQLLRSGLPLHVVARRLGHSDPMVTASIYAHVTSDQAENASAIFAKAMA